MNEVINQPKAELHIHLEGSLEPEMMYALAKRNNTKLKYSSINEIKKAYCFSNLQDFLDLYYQGTVVLVSELDFYDLTYAYLKRAAEDNVKFAEVFLDLQAHTQRGISLETVFGGVNRAIASAQKDFGINASLIVCFLRHLSEYECMKSFEALMDFRGSFIGIGLDSSELGNPPSKFKNLFDTARNEKLKLVAHAGEEGPTDYVWQAIDILGVDRIDHGNVIINDKELIQRVIKDDLALTMCPLSNKALQVTPNLKDNSALRLLEKGVKVTINSDDPAYFGGYVNENYRQIANSLNMSEADIAKLISNSLSAKFL